MKMLTKEIEATLPALYSEEKVPLVDKVLRVKFFCPWNSWTWWGTEYDPKNRLFFGLVKGQELEWGYFSLDEMESLAGPGGLKIERDRHWPPQKAGEVFPGRFDEPKERGGTAVFGGTF